MQLEYYRWLGLDIVETFVDGGEDIPVSGYLLFVAGMGLCFVQHQPLEALIRCVYALDSVGSLGTLDSGNFY